MCGLVGAAGNLMGSEKDVITTLLELDYQRGKDSTGLLVVDKNTNKYWLTKETGHPHYMFDAHNIYDGKGFLNTNINTKLVLGHNRSATVGKVTPENAHPFLHGHIVGAHNGTLRGSGLLEDAKKFDVDSEAIIYNLSKHQPKDVIPKIHGAYALTWYNFTEEKLYFIRNNERPLHYAMSTMGDIIYWASEPWMLHVALGKHRISFKDIAELPINHLHSIRLAPKPGWKIDMVDEGILNGWVPPVPPPREVGKHGNFFQGHSGSGSTASKWGPPVKTKKKGSNIVKKATGLSETVLNGMKGKEVEFYVNGEEMSMAGLTYLQCFDTTMLQDYEIRLYNTSHENYGDWQNKLTCWKGKIKNVVCVVNSNTGQEERYVTLDARTIIESTVMSDKEKPKNKKETLLETLPFEGLNYPGFYGHQTYVSFLQNTTNGCAWCKSFAMNNHQAVIFIEEDQYVCDKCVKEDYVKEFVEGYKSSTLVIN